MEHLRLMALRELEPRAAGFRPWLSAYLDNDTAEIERAVGDESLRLDYLYDYLRDEKQVAIREDGLIEFWAADYEDTEKIIGDMPVVVFHHSSDALAENISREGLRSGVSDSSRWGMPSLGVYVTTECSGPAVDGYMRRAEQTHGGDGITFTIVTRLADLQPDSNDEDIQSGRHQFVLPPVAPNDILEVREAKAAAAAPPTKLPDPPPYSGGFGDDDGFAGIGGSGPVRMR